MDYLFCAQGSQALDFATLGRTLFAFDVDGWLDAAGAVPALQQLAQHARVAAFSQRPHAALRAMLPEAVSLITPTAASTPTDRSEALHTLLAHSRCHGLMFVGDAQRNQTLFEDAPHEWLTVQIGAAPPARRAAAARYFVNDTHEAISLLRALLARVDARLAPAGG